jgi:hypothetical protein
MQGEMDQRWGRFRLVDLLVSLGCLGVLLGLFLIVAWQLREFSDRVQCSFKLSQIGVGLSSYHDIHGQFPPGYTSEHDANGNDTGPGWGWAAHALSYIGQDDLYRQMDRKQPIEAAVNAGPRTVLVKWYLCTGDVVPSKAFAVGPRGLDAQLTATLCTVAPASYIGNFGISEPGVEGEGVFFRNSAVRLKDITDGRDYTLLVGERSFRYAEATWVGAVTGSHLGLTPGSPLPMATVNASNFILGRTGGATDGPVRPLEGRHFSSNHRAGVHFVFVDGHIGLLGRRVDYAVFKAISTRAQGEPLTRADF